MSFKREKVSNLNPYAENASGLTAGQLVDQDLTAGDNVTQVSSDSEKKFGKGGTNITIGPDQPAEIGTGAPAAEGEQSMRITVGASKGLKVKSPESADGVALQANKNPNLDATTIYASSGGSSARENFGLSAGAAGKTKGAHVAIKSTDVAIAARNSIVLTTRTDTHNENGQPVAASINGIELMAGNDDSDLQPIVKGSNLVDAMTDMAKQIQALIDTVEIIRKQVADVNTAAAKHTHPDIINMVISMFAAALDEDPRKVLKKLTGGSTLVSPSLQKQCQLSNKWMNEVVAKNLKKTTVNIKNHENQYLSEAGTKCINSRHNKGN
tara:strand:+ start:675 stop:1649 length:975 start_codon:yes stop_codon:yes gene_type:complete